MKKYSTLKLLYLIVSALFLSFHLLHGLGYLVLGYGKEQLHLRDFIAVEAEIVDENTLISIGDDTQLIYTGNVKSLRIKCSFSQNPGEIVAFYSYRTNSEWSSQRMRYARWIDGYYEFVFPFGTQQIRFDTGIFPSITVVFDEIEINSGSPAEIFGFSGAELFYLLILPMLGYVILSQIKVMLHMTRIC